ncbi:MAG: SDR family oxidoreductase [Lentisphaeraceae bacterium]|nr:SDR family oxidoreductase [Lentisphaeraceae bacterium]
MSRFEGKSVFVTGAGCGIGYEICREFAQEGALVALNSRRKSQTVEAAKKINHELAKAAVFPYHGDLSDVDTITAGINDFSEKNDGLDVFVANAGITVFNRFLDVNVDEFDHLMAVNMRGTYFSVQAAAKQMIKRKIKGRIILMSSVCGIHSHLWTSAYAMTKAGIRMLAKSLAEELGKYGITVNVVSPGATTTERTLEDPEYIQGWSDVIPDRQVASCEDISFTTLFLADERAGHINGEEIVVDGGWTITGPLPEHLKKTLTT